MKNKTGCIMPSGDTIQIKQGTVTLQLNPSSPSNNTLDKSESDMPGSGTKKRPSKPQGPEYEYFEIIGPRENGKGYRLRCKFCGSREMNSHAPRMRKHLVLKCEGDVPDDVKDKFRNHKPVYTKSEFIVSCLFIHA